MKKKTKKRLLGIVQKTIKNYQNGKEKWHGKYVNGKRNGYFTLHLREGGIAVVQFKEGKSMHDHFMVTLPDGAMEKRPIKELKALM